MRRFIRLAWFPIVAIVTASAQAPARAQEEAAPPLEATPAIVEAVARIDPARIEADVRGLCAFPTRNSRSDGADQAARWIRDRFIASGYKPEDVEYHPFKLGGRTCRNVVCIRPGTRTKAPIVVIGAHYDSRSAKVDKPDAPAPGADDNASGTAGLLELARVAREVPTDWTLMFVAFSGEEQGLHGSNAFARWAHEEALPIVLMINMDMIGHPMDAARRTITIESDKGNRRVENDATSQDFAELMTRVTHAYTKLVPVPGPLYGSDYMGFEALGYPCVGLFDGADRASFYHTEQDRPDVVDARYAAEVLRIVLGSILEFKPRRIGASRS